MFFRKKLIHFLLIFLYLAQTPLKADEPLFETNQINHPVISENGMVVSEEKLATLAGLEVLKEGGNAIDAAVTVGFVLAVTFPQAGNLGGRRFHAHKTRRIKGNSCN